MRIGMHWKKKLSHFDLKSWVTGGTKIRIFKEYLSEIDVESELVKKNLTLNIESNSNIL